jgi:hypothetical protein
MHWVRDTSRSACNHVAVAQKWIYIWKQSQAVAMSSLMMIMWHGKDSAS